MRYWWVNLSKTHSVATRDDFIWCPTINAAGKAVWHWNTIHHVAPGDIVFGNWNGAVRAVGLATSHSREAFKPEDGFSFDWQSVGWRVDVKFDLLQEPINTAEMADRLRPLRPDRYSPLDKNGRAGETYLSEIPELMASVLLHELNPGIRADLLTPIRQPVSVPGDAEEDRRAEKEIEETPLLGQSEKRVLVAARRGQGLFRDNVQKIERSCRVTGLGDSSLLHAAHVKPWRVSNLGEKLDGSNGLLLSPHAHVLFDRGFITFKDNGDMLISPQLPNVVKVAWSIPSSLATAPLTIPQTRYMEFHRDAVFAS